MADRADDLDRLIKMARKVPYIQGKPRPETIALAESIVAGVVPLCAGLTGEEAIGAILIGIASGMTADPHYPIQGSLSAGMYNLACVVAAVLHLHDKPLLVT